MAPIVNERRDHQAAAGKRRSRAEARRCLLNTAAALLVAGKAKSLVEGWERAIVLIENGRAEAKLKELVAASSA